MKIVNIYNGSQVASSLVMILALVWLTVSAPFVQASQKRLSEKSTTSSSPSPFAGTEEENSASGNTTEEKKPKTQNSIAEEYLHDRFTDHLFLHHLLYRNNQDAGIYIAYHGEPLVPPPNTPC